MLSAVYACSHFLLSCLYKLRLRFFWYAIGPSEATVRSHRDVPFPDVHLVFTLGGDACLFTSMFTIICLSESRKCKFSSDHTFHKRPAGVCIVHDLAALPLRPRGFPASVNPLLTACRVIHVCSSDRARLQLHLLGFFIVLVRAQTSAFSRFRRRTIRA